MSDLDDPEEQGLAMLTAHEEFTDDEDQERQDIMQVDDNHNDETPAGGSQQQVVVATTEGRAMGVKELLLEADSHDDDDDDDDDEEPVVEAVVQAEIADDDEDDDDASVVAAVVVDDDNDDDQHINDAEEVVLEAEVIETAPAKKQSTTTSKVKNRTTSSSKAKKKKKKPKRSEDLLVSSDRLGAAAGARTMLEQSVPRLPVLISDSHVVRSFGRLQLEHATDESRFSTASALHPVGFSVDRYEFSPIHGRVLKLRCSIFDGAKIKAKQKHVDKTIPDGPVFRVMWGQGVDDDADVVDYPYDPHKDSAYISADKVDAVAIPVTGRETDDVVPEEGMRVKVRFDRDQWYTGTITEVGDEEYDKKKKKTFYKVVVEYDDGGKEEFTFPDPDVAFHLPGSDDEANERGNIKLTEIRGKPVTSVIGASALEAWGKALVELGLIDEIMLKSGLDAVAAARIEGLAEAKEKLEMQKLQRQQARARTQQRQAAKDSADSTAKAEPVKEDPPKDDEPQPSGVAESAAVGPEQVVKGDEQLRYTPTAEAAAAATGEGSKGENAELLSPKTIEPAAIALGEVDKGDGTELQASDIEDSASLTTKGVVRVDNLRHSDAEKPTVAATEEDAKGDNGQDQVEPSTIIAENNVEICQKSAEDSHKNGAIEEAVVESEPPSNEELELRAKIDSLKEELSSLLTDDSDASIALGDARISALGPLLHNPFSEGNHSRSQQASWLATVVRREKAKMGSTGNKKKVVSATGLLERNDTFFNGDIEALVEGLPGSEFCQSYVFGVLRAGGAAAVNQAWVHEARIRQERDREKQRKTAREAKAKASENREKELKRKRREEDRDERKKKRLKEEEQKKRARAEERLSRLDLQVDDRLFKEACFQREKVILLMAKTLSKEYGRRRKAAELVAGQFVITDRAQGVHEPEFHAARELPPLSQQYDEDVLRLWDFVSSFGPSFLEWGYFDRIPSLDSLQNAINAIRNEKESAVSKHEALEFLITIVVALCQPLGASLTKLLFASLIALNPALQKDFGAAFFAGVNASSTKESSADSSSTAVLPVNATTWKEIARLAFLSDALGELGYSRQETAHFLRGYRSGGHPNSKEAKRLRRAEDYSVSVLRQQIAEGISTSGSVHESHKVQVPVPCDPSCSSADWIFYLHNIKTLAPTSIKEIMKNLRKAMTLLQAAKNKPENAATLLSELEKASGIYEEFGTGDSLDSGDIAACEKARTAILGVLDEAGDKTFLAGVRSDEDKVIASEQVSNVGRAGPQVHLLQRQRMGNLNSLIITARGYKRLVHDKEEYMSDALKLKDDMERKQDRDEDDEDDEEEEEEEDAEIVDRESKKSDAGKHEPDETSVKPIEKNVAQEEEKKAGDDASNGEETSAKPNVENVAQEEKKAGDDASNGEETSAKPNEENVVQEEKKAGDNTSNGETSSAVVENDKDAIACISVDRRIGKPTPYDDFCGDVPDAPELIRRCLAVLRTLCQSGPAEPFLYPVDPQTNPGYYESVLRPMCLREAGNHLQRAAKTFMISNENSDEANTDVEEVVADFGRNIRLITKNCSCYANAGPMVVSSGEELLRIFERLFLDWVLAPEHLLPPLEFLDDERCVEYHESDEDSMVLLCDGCEGKYNMSRLVPPLFEVPNGDWFCPRCISGRCWEHLDPRIGKRVDRKDAFVTNIPGRPSALVGTVRRCLPFQPEDPETKSTLLYVVQYDDEYEETWTLCQVDKALAASGQAVSPIRCLQAVSESPGYGLGIDRGLYRDLVPIVLNPGVAEMASQAWLSSSVFRDTIVGSSSLLLIRPSEMTASEWLRLLVLLITKCSSSEIMQSLASEMENSAAELQSSRLEQARKVEDVADVLPRISDGESSTSIDEMDVEEEDPSKTAPMMPVDAQPGSVMNENVNALADVVETTEIEVVMDVDSDAVPSADAQVSVDDAHAMQTTDVPDKMAEALSGKAKRQKIREDSILAHCIKQQLRPTVSSFEEDAVSHVVDTTFSSEEPGLNLAACRCRNVQCDFCGLSDTALGTPLVRVPNRKEWNELMLHFSQCRKTFVIAEVPVGENSSRGVSSKLMTVSIRVNDELISVRGDVSLPDNVEDGGMMEFLPRNQRGFQDELKFRLDADLPFVVTGSLSAHECCAIAAHNARKERLIQEYVEKQEILAEHHAGMTCGRTLSLGEDSLGRSFWKFKGDDSLFVCVKDTSRGGGKGEMLKQWHRFSKPEDVASVIYTLGRDDVVSELKRLFPTAAGMLKSRLWSDLLLKRRFPLGHRQTEVSDGPSDVEGLVPMQKEGDNINQNDASDDEPYEEGEHVLVEARNGKLLWDAVIVGVARSEENDHITAYRVHYKEWSSRYDEWVQPFRVVEPSENNVEVQEELLEELASCPGGIPPALEKFAAKEFLNAENRVRGTAPLPHFTQVAKVGPSASSEEIVFSTTKAAALLVEAALPRGAVDDSETGPWRADLASQWRRLVRNAEGPSSLMRCIILLEDSIHPEWMGTQYTHLLSCLPVHWKAINEASVPSVALRISLIDRGLNYSYVNNQK